MRIASVLALLLLVASNATPQSGKPLVTTFMHQTLGESWQDFMTNGGTQMCASNQPKAAQLCQQLKEIEAGKHIVMTDGNASSSVSLVFDSKKLVQVLVQAKADWAKSLNELTQKYGAPDKQVTNSAAWSFADGGGISARVAPGNTVIASFYAKGAETKIAEPDVLPSGPESAYEVKGDKLGESLGAYLQKHPDDCVRDTITPKRPPALPLDPNSFHLHCTNHTETDPASKNHLTLANVDMFWQDIDFSEQRLFCVSYVFKHEVFDVIEAALDVKYGKPASVEAHDLQNGFGAHFKRSQVTWKNGVSTITLNEMLANELLYSEVEFTLDEVYAKVHGKEAESLGNKSIADL
jgi:hypothetical protein